MSKENRTFICLATRIWGFEQGKKYPAKAKGLVNEMVSDRGEVHQWLNDSTGDIRTDDEILFKRIIND